jgi:hypothetical protein
VYLNGCTLKSFPHSLFWAPMIKYVIGQWNKLVYLFSINNKKIGQMTILALRVITRDGMTITSGGIRTTKNL